MSRANKGVAVAAKKRRNKILKLAAGYVGRTNCLRIAKQRVEKALQYAYRDRRNRKRDFRALWIQRINAGVREHGLVYSQFMGALKKMNSTLDRKVLADMAVREAASFGELAKAARDFLDNNITLPTIAS